MNDKVRYLKILFVDTENELLKILFRFDLFLEEVIRIVFT